MCLFSASNLFSSFGSVCLIPYFPLLLHLPSFLSSPLRLCRLLHFPPHFLLLHSISLHSTTFAALALAFLFILLPVYKSPTFILFYPTILEPLWPARFSSVPTECFPPARVSFVFYFFCTFFTLIVVLLHYHPAIITLHFDWCFGAACFCHVLILNFFSLPPLDLRLR